MVSWKSARGYTTYQYDQQGNLLQATGTEGNTFYSYNAFNQQTAVVMANGDRLESRYDPEKLRAQTKENGKIINFLYHHGELIAELNDNGEPQGRYILRCSMTRWQNSITCAQGITIHCWEDSCKRTYTKETA